MAAPAISLHVQPGGLVSSLKWPTPGGLWEEELGVGWSGFLLASSREGLTKPRRGSLGGALPCPLLLWVRSFCFVALCEVQPSPS